MKRRYNRCHFCGGSVTEREVVVDYRWGEALLAVVKDVPVGVCEVCGEQYFKASVAKALEKTAHSRAKARETVEVPVRHLKVA